MKKRDNWKILCVVLIIILIVLIGFFAFRASERYSVMREHKGYFKGEDVQIETWMPVILVLEKFNISEDDLFNELNITGTISSRRLTIEKICEKKKLDCKVVVKNLNNLQGM